MIATMYSALVFLFCFLYSALCAPAPTDQKDHMSFANEFMTRFGYLRKVEQVSMEESLVRIEDAVKEVQRFGGLPQTGELDDLTLQLMKSARCGLPDIDRTVVNRVKRYVLSPSGGWTKRHLTYYVSSWNSHLGRNTVRVEVGKALTAWAKYGNLQFQEVTSSRSADIVVQFGKGEHGDGYPFDGTGMVLAHAFSPGIDLGGDIHFDDDEVWQVNPAGTGSKSGEDLFSVAVHEAGHSLGLSHSPNKQSVMFPYYKQYNSASFTLHSDDIAAMYQLYYNRKLGEGYESGGSTKQLTTTTTKPPTTRVVKRTTRPPPRGTQSLQPHHRRPNQRYPDERNPEHRYPPVGSPPASMSPPGTRNICEGHFDAVSFLRGEIFVFIDNFVWRLSNPGRLEPGYPVPIHRMFPQLPDRIDAAYQRDTDSNLIFFSDDKYWVHDGSRVVRGPRPISDYGLPSHVKSVDAAMVWARNGKTYIFSEDRYWRFDESLGSVDPDYPRSMELFRGVPYDLDSAMTWSDGVTYFFKDQLFWAFNNTFLRTQPSSPQDAPQHWLGCRDGQPSHLYHFHLDQLDKPKSSGSQQPHHLTSLYILLVYLLFKNAVF